MMPPSDPYGHDSRDYDRGKVSPKDLDDALLTPQERNLNRAANTMDNAGKIAKPIWGIVLFLIAGGVWFGQFYAEYKYNADNGSPAMRALMAGQQKQIENQQIQIDKLTTIVRFLVRKDPNGDSWFGFDDPKGAK